jgi:hypothetical protein
MRNYDGNDNYGKPKLDYVERIKAMSIDQLRRETKDKIWLSAFAGNNPRSDYHWHVDACYDELKDRTGSDKEYANCYKVVSKSL